MEYSIGTERRAGSCRHAAPYYPLELEFLLKAAPHDQRVSNVNVRIKDAHDKMLLNVKTDGPFLLARPPAGNYTVSAERNDEVRDRTIQIVPREHQRMVFEWRK